MNSTDDIYIDSESRSRFSFGKVMSLVAIFISIAIFAFGGLVFFGSGASSLSDITGEGRWQAIRGVTSSLFSRDAGLAGETEGRTNMLIFGEDDRGDGTTGSDTIILLSYFYEQDDFVAVTVPRDIVVQSDYGQNKITDTYAKAESDNSAGAQTIESVIENEYDIDVHYWVKLNFQAVTDLIDSVGGITVDVENGFTDCVFPDGFDRTLPCFTIDAGLQEMDGSTALKYARSRQGFSDNGSEEGSDFARSRRQTIVIESLINKFQDSDDIFTPRKLDRYLRILGDNVRVSLASSELRSAYTLFYDKLVGSDSGFDRINFQTGNGFLCEGSVFYTIVYCDGYVLNDGFYSDSRQQAIEVIQNPLRYINQGQDGIYSDTSGVDFN